MNSDVHYTKKPIVLVGMMGVGKTHIGYKLARILGVTFFDSDKLVEEKAGCAISEIFERFGEQKFREAEANTIHELLDRPACVIATGGGALTAQKTLESLKIRATVIWLKLSPENIFERIRDSGHRPLLNNDDPLQTLRDLSRQREHLYNQADIHIDVDDLAEEEIIQHIIKRLSESAKNDNV